MDETALLAALLHSRKAYEAVQEHLDPESMTAHGGALLECIDEYYGKDSKATQCSVDIIRARVSRKLPKHKETFAVMLREMTPELGSINVVQEVLELKRRSVGEALTIGIATGTAAVDLQPVLDEFAALNSATGLLDASGMTVLETSFAEVAKEIEDPTKLIKLMPYQFNQYIGGGVLPGHCVVEIGRVNVGKSAGMINNIVGFLRQDLTVLLVENEDLPTDVKRRIGCRLVNVSMKWAAANPEKFESVASKRGGDNLIILDPAPMTTKQVDAATQQFKPDVLVVNQLRHLAPSHEAASDNTGAVDRVVQQLRALGKRRRIMTFLVGAALEGERTRDGTPHEKAVLDMDDSYGSRTGVPGCADVMFGIGVTTSLKERGMLCIHLCKNKRGKEEPVIYFNVDLERCRFT